MDDKTWTFVGIEDDSSFVDTAEAATIERARLKILRERMGNVQFIAAFEGRLSDVLPPELRDI